MTGFLAVSSAKTGLYGFGFTRNNAKRIRLLRFIVVAGYALTGQNRAILKQIALREN